MRSQTSRKLLVACFSLFMFAQAFALIVAGTGRPTVSGWPAGAAAVAYLPSSVGWWEGPPFGGGEWHVQFRGDTEAFRQVLTNFTAIRAATLDLVIHDGPHQEQFLKSADQDSDTSVDWELVVWNAGSWNQLYHNPNATFTTNSPNFRKPVPPPRLDVFIGGGGVDWTKVEIPDGLNVRDERASAASVTNLLGGHHP